MKEALEIFEEVKRLNPHDTGLQSALCGSACFELGQVERAVEYFKKAVQEEGLEKLQEVATIYLANNMLEELDAILSEYSTVRFIVNLIW